MNTIEQQHRDQMRSLRSHIDHIELLRRFQLQDNHLLDEYSRGILRERYATEVRESEAMLDVIQKWLMRREAYNKIGPTKSRMTYLCASLDHIIYGVRLPLPVNDGICTIAKASQKITRSHIKQIAAAWCCETLEIAPSPVRTRIVEALDQAASRGDMIGR